MRNDRHAPGTGTEPGKSRWMLPRPTPQFRRRAWNEFQRALDPLALTKAMRGSSLRRDATTDTGMTD